MNEITVRDVTPRDGLQDVEHTIPTAGKRELIECLHGAGLRWVEATSFVSPKAVPQLADASDLCASLDRNQLDGMTLSAFVATLGGLERAVDAGVDEISTTVPATDGMTQANFRRDRDAMLGEVLAMRESADLPMSVTIAVAFACPFEGRVPVDRVLSLVDELFLGGFRVIFLGDTIGFANPRSVEELVAAVVDRFGSGTVGAHFHDARGSGIANALAAARAGAGIVDSALGGLGGCPFAPGAAGNVATEDVVWVLGESGFDTGLQHDEVADAAQWMASALGVPTQGRSSDARRFEWEEAA